MNKYLSIFISVCVVLTLLIGIIGFYPGFNIDFMNWLTFSLLAFVGAMEVVEYLLKHDAKGRVDE